MKIVLSFLFVIAILLYSGGMQITLSPFRVKFNTPCLGLGLFFLLLSISFWGYHYYSKGKAEGVKETIELLKNTADEKTKNR
jgi:hypothetical protein